MVRVYILGLLCIFSFSISAEDIGVAAASGNVSAGPEGHLQAVKIGSRIADGSTVQTGPGALAVLSFSDDSRVKLKENTQLTVHAVAGKTPRGVELITGALFALISKRPHQSFQVRTPIAVAGVRGTQFFTSYEKSKAKEQNVWMCVEEGQVEMTELEHPTPVLVSAGYGIVVEKGKAIEAPKKYEWTKNLNWNMDPEKGDLVDKTKLDGEYENLLKHDYD
jgi:ferric-dicitrate binding protein FerR (iron transport regulator)